MSFNFNRRISVLAMAASLGACVSGPAPANISGSAWLPGQDLGRTSGHPEGDWVMAAPAARGAPTCDWRAPRELDTLRRAIPPGVVTFLVAIGLTIYAGTGFATLLLDSMIACVCRCDHAGSHFAVGTPFCDLRRLI